MPDGSEGGGPAEPSVLVVASAVDPVARALANRWGTPPATGLAVDGAAVRRFPDGPYYLRRPEIHIHDERLDLRLPPEIASRRPTLVFPSIHRSAQNVRSLTVHPLGNPGSTAEVGGRPRALVPTNPSLMTAALRALAEEGGKIGSTATFEATHHGPELGLPAFFVEIGFGELEGPPEDEVEVLARVLPRLAPEVTRHVALGVGGGHYVPHFTDLALRREWAFGHLLSRHALEQIDAPTVRAAWEGTPGAQGVLFARAADQAHPALQGLGPRLKDGDAPPRSVRPDGPG